MVPSRNGPRGRRRVVVAGVVAGVLAGIAAGAALLGGASSPASGGPRPEVLHAAPAIVTANSPVSLGAATVCTKPEAASCAVSTAVAYVRPAGTNGWSRVDGEPSSGGYRFTVPRDLVPADGFSYWLQLVTRDGARVDYPPAGQTAPLRVLTTAQLPTRTVAEALDWDRPRSPDGQALRVAYGDGTQQVGRIAGKGDLAPSGPSSFDVGPDGSIQVADWVNGRLQVFDAEGSYRRSAALPFDEPMDVAIGAQGQVYLATLGIDARVVEMSPAGEVVGRYPVAYGVSARVGAAPEGPRVFVGPNQWAAVSVHRGIPLSAEDQSRLQTASVPQADGGVGIASPVGRRRFAAVWTRPDGSRGGTVVTLPSGTQVGSDYLVQALPDGGAVVAQGVWDETHAGVGLFRFDAGGRIASFSLLPEPTVEQASRFSTVRFRAPDEVLVAYSTDHAFTIARFEVSSR